MSLLDTQSFWSAEDKDSLLSYLTPPNSPPQCTPEIFDLDAPLSNHLLLNNDDLTFDKLSIALSRALTPPPETLSASKALVTPTPSDFSNFHPHPNCETCLRESRLLASPAFQGAHQVDYHTSLLPLSNSEASSDLLAPSLTDDPLFEPMYNGALQSPPVDYSQPLTSTYHSSSTTVPVAKRSSSTISKPTTKSKQRVTSSKTLTSIAKAKLQQAQAALQQQPVTVAAKRESHNLSERHRRLAMKESFDQLRQLIPEVASNERVHTGQILKAAIDYMRQLQAEDQRLMLEKEQLQESIRQHSLAL